MPQAMECQKITTKRFCGSNVLPNRAMPMHNLVLDNVMTKAMALAKIALKLRNGIAKPPNKVMLALRKK